MIVKRLMDLNGEPEVFTHECDLSRKGQPMSYDELETFVARCIASAYAKRGVKYEWNDNRRNSASPHFLLHMDLDVNVIVNIDCPRITDFTEVLYKFEEYGQVPRLFVAEVFCFETNGGEPVCGGSYAIKFTPTTLLIHEKESVPPESLSDNDLLELLARAWNELDISIIEPYFSKYLHYSSEWVFDLLPSRYEYLDYIRAKFDNIRNSGNSITASPLLYSKAGIKGVLIGQNGEEDILSVKTRDGLISEMEMRDRKCLYEGIDPEPVVIETGEASDTSEDGDVELYEGHGDHWEAIMPMDKYRDILRSLIEESRVASTIKRPVALDGFEGQTDVAILIYGNKDFANVALICNNKARKVNELVTTYPAFFDGSAYPVKITKVVEWSNRTEAIVWGEIGDFEVAFFATDYVNCSASYRVGETIDINLTGLAMHISEAQRGFEFTGQQAIDFLAKMGEEPNHLPNGEVEPVRFDTSNLVVFMQVQKKSPEDARFQSPIQSIEYRKYLGVPMTRAEIIIHRSDRDDSQITMPLYFRTDMLPDAKVSDPVQGYLWLMGEVPARKRSDE